MPPEVLETIGAFIGLFGIGSMVLIGMKLRYNYLLQKGRGGVSEKEVERLNESVEALRGEIAILRDGYLELNDRVEFAERLLEKPKAGKSDSDTPSR